MVNANAEVYYESSTNIFTYKGSLTSGNSMKINASSENPIWVLVTPTSNSASVSFSSYTTESSSSLIDNGTLIAIILPITFCCVILIYFVAWIIVCKILRRKRMHEAQSNARAAITTPREPMPQPQLYYPQNQTYSNISINPPPSAIYTLPPTYPHQQHSYSAQQQMFIMDPVPLPSPSKQGPCMFPPVHQPAQPSSFVVPTDANLQIDIPDQSKVE